MHKNTLVALTILLVHFATASVDIWQGTASAADLSLSIQTFSSSIELGEPLVVRGKLRNNTGDTKLVPVRSPEGMLHTGFATYYLLDERGLAYRYRRHVLVNGPWLPDEVYPLEPGDSLYWQQMLVPDFFCLAGAGAAPRSGAYELVAALRLPMFSGAHQKTQWFRLEDTTSFKLSSTQFLPRELQPYRSLLSEGLWARFTASERADCQRLLESLDSLPLSVYSSYPHLSFAALIARFRLGTDAELAFAEAQSFIADHPMSPLAEEMGFDLLEFWYLDKAGMRRQADSIEAALLQTYPRNIRAATISAMGGRVRRPK